MRDLAHDVDHWRDWLDHDHGDHRIGDVLLEPGGDPIAQLDGGQAGGDNVAEERQRDFAIGTNLQRLRQLRVLVDLDA